MEMSAKRGAAAEGGEAADEEPPAPGRAWFVGRGAELSAAERLLDDGADGLRVLLVDGPGGVGKSALLFELARRARRRGWTVRRVEGNGLQSIGSAAGDGERLIVLVDDWDGAATLERFLGGPSALPEAARVVVLASRRAAPLGADSFAARGVRIERLSLSPLPPDDARALLAARGLDGEASRELATRLGGHPLVLALVAELHLLRGELPQSLDEAPELVAVLLRRLVDATPDPAQREALEALATVRSLTESLLEAMLARADVHALFTWLAERSFVAAQPSGLVAHDLVREALATDLAWRSPERADAYKRRALSLLLRRLRRGTLAEQTRAMSDLFFLFRAHPVMRMFAQWAAIDRLLIDQATPADHAPALDAIRRHEGAASAQLAAHWLARHPDGAYVIRKSGGAAVGFSQFLRLDRLRPDDRGRDPVVDAALAHLAATGVDARQPALLHRYWLGFESYQSPGDIHGMSVGLAAHQHVVTGGLAYALGTFADAARYEAVFAIFGYDVLDTVRVGGRPFTLVGRDWREEPPLVWFGGYAERLLGLPPEAAVPDDEPAPAGDDDWFAHTRDALRGLHEPHRAASSLLALRLVGKKGSVIDRAARLRALIGEAVAALSGSRRGQRAMTALEATYLEPEGTQEEVAEALDLPFSTYRRHLNEGITLLADFLRQSSPR
jgi:hypothetical protein